MKPRRSLVALLLVLLPSLAAAAPRDEALRLVPEDVAFCVVVQDLRGHAEALAGSPFLRQFHESPLGAALRASPELKKLQAVQQQLEKELQIDLPHVRDDLLGDALVVAYRPGPPGAMAKQDQDLIVVRARDARLLARLIDRVNQLQQQKKEVTELEPRTHAGQTYYRRVDRGHENFYFLHGPLLAVSSQEAMLQQAIDLDRRDSADEPFVARQLRLLGADKALAALWVNPRPFEAEMERKAATAAKEQEATVTRAFLTYWKALDGIAVTFDLRQDAELGLAVRARPEALPPAARRFLAALAQPSELWARFPDTALVAAAGRFDAAAFADLLGDFLTTEDRQGLVQALQGGLGAIVDKDVMRDLVPNVGPDWGMYVAAPPAGDRAWFPRVLVALRVRPGEGGVDSALFTALKSYIPLGVIGYNSTHKDQVSVKTEQQGPVEVKYLANEQFPPGLNPAFALKGGYLLLASSPEVVRGFGPVRPAAAEGDEVPLFRLSLAELRRYVRERRGPLATATAEKNQISREEAEHRLGGLLLGLQFFDRLEVTQRPGPGRVTLTLRLRPERPFK